MSGKSWLAPLTGIVFIVLLIVGLALGGEPPDPSDKPIDEVVDFYVDNKDDVFLGSVLQGLACAFFLFFAATLYKALRASGADASAIGVIAGATVFTVGGTLDATINLAAAEAAEDVDPVAVQSLAALWTGDFLPFAVGGLVFLMSWGIAIVRHGAFPAWMGWVAIVAALAAVSPGFFVALIVMALMIVAASVMLAMRGKAAADGAASPS